MTSIRHNWPQLFSWPPSDTTDLHFIVMFILYNIIIYRLSYHLLLLAGPPEAELEAPQVCLLCLQGTRAGRALIFLAVRQAKRNATWRRRILRLLWHSEIVCNLYILFPFKNQCWKRVPIRRKKQGDCNNNTFTLTKEKRQFLQIIEKIFNILCTFCTLKKQLKKSLKKKLSFNRISNLSL